MVLKTFSAIITVVNPLYVDTALTWNSTEMYLWKWIICYCNTAHHCTRNVASALNPQKKKDSESTAQDMQVCISSISVSIQYNGCVQLNRPMSKYILHKRKIIIYHYICCNVGALCDCSCLKYIRKGWETLVQGLFQVRKICFHHLSSYRLFYCCTLFI